MCVCVHVCARLHVCVYIDCSCRKPKHLHFVHLLESKQEEAGTETERERLHAIERERERQAAAWFIAAAKLLQYALECPSCLPSLSTALSLSPSRSRSSRLNCVNGLEIVFAPCAA